MISKVTVWVVTHPTFSRPDYFTRKMLTNFTMRRKTHFTMTIDLKAEREKLLKRAIAQDRITGAQMRKKREQRGLKSSWVADKMGIAGSYLSDLERGNRHWRQHHVDAFLKSIGEL